MDDAQLTGWHAYPLGSSGLGLPSPLWVLGISRRAGPVLRGDAARQRGWDGIGHYLDPSEWDGSDLFRPSNEGQERLGAASRSHTVASALRSGEIAPPRAANTPSAT